MVELNLEEVRIFKLNENEEEFEELKRVDKTLIELLESNYVFSIVDPIKKILWLWHGKKTQPRVKFIAARKAPFLRDKYGVDYKISAIDENREPEEFEELLLYSL